MTADRTRSRTVFTRSADRTVFGVAAGLADFLGVDCRLVRSCFVLMTLGSGIGIALYGLAYAFSESPDARPAVPHPVTARHNIGIIAIAVGISLFGLQLFADNVQRLLQLRGVWLAVVITGAIALLVLGPWLLRLISALNEERNDRIRSEERSDISAHLHDSVLNTLALIQRSEAKPEVIMLARRQERELRAWMQGRSTDENSTLSAALDALTSRVEEQYNVSIDAVLVGPSVPIHERVRAFTAALQEATTNAARHSGTSSISVYVEVEAERITGFVRDQGHGFSRSAVDADRRGITESIEGRMKRIGGTSAIRSTIGEGTEVELCLPYDSRSIDG